MFISFLHEPLLKTNNDKLNKKRKDFLNGRDLTLALKTNILNLNESISDDLFNQIDNLRSRRNKIVHNIEKLAKSGELYSDDFKEMFNTVNELLFLVEGFNIRISGGYSFRTIQ